MLIVAKLSNDALRVLAGLLGNERAFAQLTIKPLDPADATIKDHRGPDSPDNYTANADLRAYEDTLDGRSTNRYFYRAGSVDGAHNRSKGLSLSSPPVYCSDVVQPRAPVITRVTGGDRKITLSWESNREADLFEYRIHRADSADARDLRSMTQVATVVADRRIRPRALRRWLDRLADPRPQRLLVPRRCRRSTRPGRSARRRRQRVDAFARGEGARRRHDATELADVDRGGATRPAGGVRLAWRTDEADVICIVNRRLPGGVWRPASQRVPPSVAPFDFEFVDMDDRAGHDVRVSHRRGGSGGQPQPRHGSQDGLTGAMRDAPRRVPSHADSGGSSGPAPEPDDRRDGARRQSRSGGCRTRRRSKSASTSPRRRRKCRSRCRGKACCSSVPIRRSIIRRRRRTSASHATRRGRSSAISCCGRSRCSAADPDCRRRSRRTCRSSIRCRRSFASRRSGSRRTSSSPRSARCRSTGSCSRGPQSRATIRCACRS